MYTTDYYGYDSAYETTSLAVVIIPLIIVLAASVLIVIATWKIFKKAGEPGWNALFPGVNTYKLFKIAFCAEEPWFLLVLVPIANIVVSIIATIKLSERFGHGIGFGIGLILLPVVFFPILAFGKSEYQPI
ncbi:MAG: DUF5684 domain-containing protein [Lentihominibacter sp.]|jgi:hypothetical protein